jgi:hypothetical protein
MTRALAFLLALLVSAPAGAQLVPPLQGAWSGASSTFVCSPSWLPCPGGVAPMVAFDVTQGNYWYNGTSYGSLSAWMTATGATFTRANPEYCTGSDGFFHMLSANVICVDYDPVSLLPLGVLSQPLYTNALLYSSVFSNAAWTKTNVTETDNAARSPENTTTGASLLANNASAVPNEISQTVAGFGHTAICSAYLAFGTGDGYLNVAVDDGVAGDYVQAVFDVSPTHYGATEFSTGTGSGSPILRNMLIEPAPGGWYHVVVGMLQFGSSTSATCHFGFARSHSNTYTSSGQAIYGSTTDIGYVWCAQLPSLATPLNCSPTTSVPTSSGGDTFALPTPWDSASNPMSFLVDFNTRGQTASSSYPANAVNGGTNVWDARNGAPLLVEHWPDVNAAQINTGIVPGLNAVGLRDNSTTITASGNGNPAVSSAPGSARTAAATVRLGDSNLGSSVVRISGAAGWPSGVTNSQLAIISKIPSVPAPRVTVACDLGNPKWTGFPGLGLLPSGYLLVTYEEYNTATQGARPSQIMYRTTPGPNGPCSAEQVAVVNADAAIDVQMLMPLVLPGGTVMGIYSPENFTAPFIAGSGTLKLQTATEGSPGVLTWGMPAAITGSPFFGTNAGGTFKGDFTVSRPILTPFGGLYMQLFYGPRSGASGLLTDVGAIFSTTPSNPASWGSFAILTNGAIYVNPLAFSEATGFVDSGGNIVVFMRQDNNVAGTLQNYWRIVCPAGLDPRTASNWLPPTHVAFSLEVGKPDTLNLGSSVLLWTRTAQGSNNLVGYNVAPGSGQSPFPSNRAAFGAPNRQYWYSDSAFAADGSPITALARDGSLGGGAGTEIDLILSK